MKKALIILIVGTAVVVGGLIIVQIKYLEKKKKAELAIKEARSDSLMKIVKTQILKDELDSALLFISAVIEENIKKDVSVAAGIKDDIEKLRSEEYLKRSLLSLWDEDYKLLLKKELTTKYLGHPKLDSLFKMKMYSNRKIKDAYKKEKKAREAGQKAEEKRKKIFYDLVLMQDMASEKGYSDEMAYELVAKDYNISKEKVRKIGIEGVEKKWPMPKPRW